MAGIIEVNVFEPLKQVGKWVIVTNFLFAITGRAPRDGVSQKNLSLNGTLPLEQSPPNY
jgi:hypothetical protein